MCASSNYGSTIYTKCVLNIVTPFVSNNPPFFIIVKIYSILQSG